jgi:cytochrome c oxidase subunit 4
MTTRPSTYLFTLLALVALSFLTFGLSYVHLGGWSITIAMLIAAVKATLIAMVFMGLREHGTGDRAALVLGVVLAVLLIGFAAADVATRTRLASTIPAPAATIAPN